MKQLTIKQRIVEYFETSEWQYKFIWADGHLYGDKYETIKSLAKIFNCPKTSLYFPVKELVDEGFITYEGGLIMYERKITNYDSS